MARIKESGAQVLYPDQTESHEFYVLHFGGAESLFQVDLREHNGGTWTLQFKAPDGTWQDADTKQVWAENGIKTFAAIHKRPFRLFGGDAGAKAWYYFPV